MRPRTDRSVARTRLLQGAPTVSRRIIAQWRRPARANLFMFAIVFCVNSPHAQSREASAICTVKSVSRPPQRATSCALGLSVGDWLTAQLLPPQQTTWTKHTTCLLLAASFDTDKYVCLVVSHRISPELLFFSGRIALHSITRGYRYNTLHNVSWSDK